jgi:subfamily B ATP-binding cassette protein MsbA
MEPQGARLESLLTEVDNVQYGVSGVVGMVRNPLTLMGLLAAMWWVAPSLTLWALWLAPVVFLSSRWGGRILSDRSRRHQEARSALAELASDQLGAAPAIRSQVAEMAEQARFREVAIEEAHLRVRLDTDRVLPRSITRLGAMAVLGVLLMVGHEQVASGELQASGWIALMAAMGLAAKPLGDLAEAWSLMKRSQAALVRVRAILGGSGEVAQGGAVSPLSHLRWEDVGLQFPGRSPVFESVSVEVKVGQVLGITGVSGSGKTSLLKMVTGDLHPTSGEVHAGGMPLKDWDIAALREQIAVVHQDPFLLCRTIRENVSLGTDLTDVDIWDALNRAGCGFVHDLVGGLDFELGQDGAPLSGGERQRLCLARALARRAPVVLLDEPTSQVDPATVAAFATVLGTLKRDAAVVLVTHDPALQGLMDVTLRLPPPVAEEVALER